MSVPVYFLSLRATSENDSVLLRLKKLTRHLVEGKVAKNDFVAVKLHFGERGNHGFIRPVFVRSIVEAIREAGAKPFLTDTNTLYTGFRHNAVDHLETALFHGFGYPAVPAPLIIADGLRGNDEVEVKVEGNHFQTVKIARAIHEADFLFALTHVKGHMETGLGGAIKNLGMGCASRAGKQMQHGETFFPQPQEEKCIGCQRCIRHCPTQALFLNERKKAGLKRELCIGCAECLLYCPTEAIEPSWSSSSALLQERMVEYALGVLQGKKGKCAFINFITDVSPDCDCAPWHDASLIPDVGILGSHDLLAIDQASADFIQASQGLPGTELKNALGPGTDKLLDVHPEALWQTQLDYAEKLGLGKRTYELQHV
ncbi:MAG: DUF362 domain-containing protein [Atribacterota bacterium]